MSRAASTVETCGRIRFEFVRQASANSLKAATSSARSAGSSGVWSTCVYLSMAGPFRHSTGLLRSTPRGSKETMSYWARTAAG